MIIYEYRIVLPFSEEEYQRGHRYTVSEFSLQETGGGEGVEIVTNEPHEGIIEGEKTGQVFKSQYTHKVIHLQSKVPQYIRALAPKGSLEVHEKSWNAYPYCRTVLSNDYMKNNFTLSFDTHYLADTGETDNVHGLTEEELKTREVVYIDIVNDAVDTRDYKEHEDPTKFHSEKTGRGPLAQDWKCFHALVDAESNNNESTSRPVMCAYKLMRCNFSWFGLQQRIEQLIQRSMRRLLFNFHRKAFCQIDQWYGLTMSDVTAIEKDTKLKLNELREDGTVRGMAVK